MRDQQDRDEWRIKIYYCVNINSKPSSNHTSTHLHFDTTKMFGGPPPQPSPAELKAQEEEATLTVQRVITWSILLYLSPFAVKSIQNLI
ncbi:hypothetical protein EYC80_009105 [Monilinia laxa]|uniref:Uncharacterized protein n=3 Tax=Sclerotiniaceae TaxID=28983 RepID=A0A5N6K2G3_MONLA|nr:hypothetical protein EYC80_009105 [Monilinia laxa]